MAATADEIRDVNTRYHDGAARGYDAKWGIDFGARGRQQVLGKLGKALGQEVPRFGRSLEIGAGTGYFSLNMLAAGVIDEAVCTDISGGMVVTLRGNAARLGIPVQTAICGAEDLPFASGSFDLVHGHAVLHHIPDLRLALGEMLRVLRPGGTICFAGEPSRRGDSLARVPKQAAALLAPVWRVALGARRGAPGQSDGGAANNALERHVDVHAFTAPELRDAVTASGFESCRVSGEELLAGWFGWFNRGLEATAAPASVPIWWKRYAHRGYLALQRADRPLERAAPSLAYNLLVSGRAPLR